MPAHRRDPRTGGRFPPVQPRGPAGRLDPRGAPERRRHHPERRRADPYLSGAARRAARGRAAGDRGPSVEHPSPRGIPAPFLSGPGRARGDRRVRAAELRAGAGRNGQRAARAATGRSMTKHQVDADLVRKLAALLDETGLTELEYATNALRVRVAKNHAGAATLAP